MRYLYDSPVSKLAFINLAGNCVNAFFDGSLFMHADETKHLWPRLCEFLW